MSANHVRLVKAGFFFSSLASSARQSLVSLGGRGGDLAARAAQRFRGLEKPRERRGATRNGESREDTTPRRGRASIFLLGEGGSTHSETMSADEDDNDTGEDCPLCCNPFDATDKHFRPCKCGYQICAWCWHQRECPPRPPASSEPAPASLDPAFFFSSRGPEPEEDARVLPPDRPTRDLTVRVPVSSQ